MDEAERMYDKLSAIAERAMTEIMEHGGESVLILATFQNKKTTHGLRKERGNWYANKGAAYDYLNEHSITSDVATDTDGEQT